MLNTSLYNKGVVDGTQQSTHCANREATAERPTLTGWRLGEKIKIGSTMLKGQKIMTKAKGKCTW